MDFRFLMRPNSSDTAAVLQQRRCFALLSSAANTQGMGEKHRKARVTAEHREEAAKLYALWKATNHGLTQAEFGERYAVGNQSAVGQFLRGDAPLSQKAAAGFAKGLGCSIAAFSPRIASELNERKAHEEKPGDDEFALVQRADVKLSAGHGHIVYHEG